MFQAGIKKTFNIRHFLIGDFDEETVPHTHVYAVEWRVGTLGLDENGFSVNIALMEELLEKLLRQLDDTLLNDLDFFENKQVSVENTALFIYRHLFEGLRQNNVDPAEFSGMEIKIWESDEAWAAYSTGTFGESVTQA